MNNPLGFLDPSGRKAATFEPMTIFGINVFEVRDDGQDKIEFDKSAPSSLNTSMGNDSKGQTDSAEFITKDQRRPVIYI